MESLNKDSQMMMALQATQGGQNLSARAAARTYNVSLTTLTRRLKGIPSRRDTVPNSRKLTDLEESTIIQYVLDLDARSFPPRLCGVRDMANLLLADRDAPPVGPRWASNFVKRHKELSTRFTRRYDYQRALCEDPAVNRLLIMDGHESRHSTEFELFCQDHKIITLCMPSHSSHILQPLDVGCFGPLKKAYGREIEGLMKAHITHITKADFLPAFFAAFQASMTKKNIKGGFRGAGIAPFDAESVLSRLDVKLRTPSPVEGHTELPNPWVPKTPNNPTEATSQTDYIKKRINGHQGSSPTSILTAIDQVAKGACGIMHRMALLQAEIGQLREANATLSKRRRARKNRLRQGGSMTIAEGQALRDQKDVEQQLQQDIRQTRCRKPRVETKVRRCGTCGKSGHNARTCQITVETSNEEESHED